MRNFRWLGVVALIAAAGSLVGCGLLDPPPVANFSWTPSDPIARSDVTFSDNSTDQGGPLGGAAGVKSWNWDFGDSGDSSSRNPKHSYSKGGTYSVKLTVTDASGGTSSVTKEIIITPSLTGLWTGTITSVIYVQWTLILNLTHSIYGTISGTITIGREPQAITSASFDPGTREVQITSEAFGLILRGNLNASETEMSGLWYDDDTGDRGEDWRASRPPQ
jgi:PKD repeat protein